jgi:hypothetical protein
MQVIHAQRFVVSLYYQEGLKVAATWLFIYTPRIDDVTAQKSELR